MVERVDPARTGVLAGRIVGVLTAVLAVASLLSVRETYYAQAAVLLEVAGAGGVPVAGLFWGNAALSAAARYGVCYVVGSLVGVAYDWLDRPSLWALAAMVGVVGAVDGALAALDTRSAAIGAAYIAAWLCYVPAFARLFDGDEDDDGAGRSGGASRGPGRARRLGVDDDGEE
jgi:hypothetical protein